MKRNIENDISILGAKISLGNEEELLRLVQVSLREKKKITVLSGNIRGTNLAYEHAWLRNYFNHADFVHIDGVGLRLGAWILGYRTPQRITWADFIWRLTSVAEKNNYSLFFLGGRPGVAEKAANRLRERNKNLKIVGTHHGYFDKSKNSAENEEVIRKINDLKPDILVIGFGMPIQEKWSMENREQIDVNVVFTEGGIFDIISGELTRPPKWLTDHGLEWLGRLVIEPRRLWKRYLIGNPLFFIRVIRQRLGLLKFD